MLVQLPKLTFAVRTIKIIIIVSIVYSLVIIIIIIIIFDNDILSQSSFFLPLTLPIRSYYLTPHRVGVVGYVIFRVPPCGVYHVYTRCLLITSEAKLRKLS